MVESLIKEMFEVMQEEKGIGLAANQIGSGCAVFVLGIEGVHEHYINPEVLSQSNPVDYEEGCLSIPGTSAMVNRYNTLTLKYSRLVDDSITEHEDTFEGIKAIAIQHEMDHLNGKLYIDTLGPVRKRTVLDKHKKFLKQLLRS